MKFALLLTLVSSSAFASTYVCKGDGLTVELSNSRRVLTITTAATGAVEKLKVTNFGSRTSEEDETYAAEGGISLVVDEQYGDRLVRGEDATPLTCGRPKPAQ